jgi:hypothetical protein
MYLILDVLVDPLQNNLNFLKEVRGTTIHLIPFALLNSMQCLKVIYMNFNDYFELRETKFLSHWVFPILQKT